MVGSGSREGLIVTGHGVGVFSRGSLSNFKTPMLIGAIRSIVFPSTRFSLADVNTNEVSDRLSC